MFKFLFHDFKTNLVTKSTLPLIKEDEVFRRIAGEYEPKNWAVIAKRLASEFGFKKRTGKQCRER